MSQEINLILDDGNQSHSYSSQFDDLCRLDSYLAYQQVYDAKPILLLLGQRGFRLLQQRI